MSILFCAIDLTNFDLCMSDTSDALIRTVPQNRRSRKWSQEAVEVPQKSRLIAGEEPTARISHEEVNEFSIFTIRFSQMSKIANLEVTDVSVR